ncbi:MAG: GNAT family N-acetyltransferase [Winogradskyella sp.]|uniref:GNAT family N-acetyltransferase n=1 Tax=Winogradskyella sp. TaxID=1883156 RepID=UPI00182A4BCF|nr:GNAT family N-acetyltransferase [Winogradskyella sp.]MBT8244593.1 GNAT family N-acetyltransferase [Winogradskyella sp.]NNK22669.1 GNAT family N-acetyltransferase [Winogradskyella sp.]
MNNIVYGTVTSDDQLKQILKLQKKNLFTTITKEERKSEGFVTVSHSFDVLKRMNDAQPHIIAKDGDTVVGYALCMLKQFKADVPLLVPMFDFMDSVLEIKNLSDLKFVIMGQICIDKAYRKQGVFGELYKKMSSELKENFDIIITEVNTKNKRSSFAHQAVGFETLDMHSAHGEEWELILLKL